MSLMGTLGKVAMGVIVAKGVGKLMNGGASNNAGGGLGGLLGSLAGSAMGGGSSAGGLGGLLGSLTGGSSSAGGLGGLLGSLTGGGQGGQQSGGLGGLLGSLTGGQGGSSAGGLGDLLGGLTGQGGQGGGLGGLLNSLGGGAQNSAAAGNSGGFGDLFNTALQGKEPEVTAADEKTAELMLRAMISAAKADGQIDENEQKIITEHLGDISADEANFVRKEMQAPVDLPGLVASVPAGMEQQVYLMSLLAITLDNQEEAAYLDKLAQGLKISQQACNDIHDQLGAPKLYS